MARGTKQYKHVESWVMENCLDDLRGGAVFAGNYAGHIIFHTTELKDQAGKTAETLVQAHHVVDGVVQSIHPDALYGLDDVDDDPGAEPHIDATAVF